MSERRILSIDNRRDRSKPFQSVFFPTTHVLNPQYITDVTPGDVTGYGLIAIKGGDGTIGYVLNTLSRTDDNPAIFLSGGGSANTLLKGLKTTAAVAIPNDLTEYFSPDSFEAHLYRPPQIISDQGKETVAYLVAPDHLGVDVTKTREWMEANNLNVHMHLTYIASGLVSLFKLWGRVEPKDVVGIDQQKIAAAAVIAVPILGTFKLLNSIDSDKVRLLSIAAQTEYALFLKYLSTLIVASSFPHGADMAIKLGIMTSRDVEKVSLLTDPDKSPNACIDGELRVVRGKIDFVRSPQGRLFIIPK